MPASVQLNDLDDLLLSLSFADPIYIYRNSSCCLFSLKTRATDPSSLLLDSRLPSPVGVDDDGARREQVLLRQLFADVQKEAVSHELLRAHITFADRAAPAIGHAWEVGLFAFALGEEGLEVEAFSMKA